MPASPPFPECPNHGGNAPSIIIMLFDRDTKTTDKLVVQENSACRLRSLAVALSGWKSVPESPESAHHKLSAPLLEEFASDADHKNQSPRNIVNFPPREMLHRFPDGSQRVSSSTSSSGLSDHIRNRLRDAMIAMQNIGVQNTIGDEALCVVSFLPSLETILENVHNAPPATLHIVAGDFFASFSDKHLDLLDLFLPIDLRHHLLKLLCNTTRVVVHEDQGLLKFALLEESGTVKLLLDIALHDLFQLNQNLYDDFIFNFVKSIHDDLLSLPLSERQIETVDFSSSSLPSEMTTDLMNTLKARFGSCGPVMSLTAGLIGLTQVS